MMRFLGSFVASAVVFVLAFPARAFTGNVGGNIPLPGGGNVGVNVPIGGGGGGAGMWSNFGLPTGTITGIVSAFVMWILALFGFIGIIGFVISGIMYLLAAGDEGQAEKAKEAMKYSIIGVIVGLIGYVVLQAVNTWLNAGASF